MTRWVAFALVLLGCSAAVPTHDSAFAGVGEMVPQSVLDEALPVAIAELEACAGKPLGDLDGWSFWYPAGLVGLDGRFACGELPECGPLPDGCSCAAECPCRCAGLTFSDTMQIVLTPGLGSLKHELIHAGYRIEVHSTPEWKCQ
jgi:hypothetical protein